MGDSCRLPVGHEGSCDRSTPAVIDYEDGGGRRARTISPISLTSDGGRWTLWAVCHETGKRVRFLMEGISRWKDQA